MRSFFRISPTTLHTSSLPSGLVNKDREKSQLFFRGYNIGLNKAQHLVGEGFPAGLAEMEVNIKRRAANSLYHIGRRRVRGG